MSFARGITRATYRVLGERFCRPHMKSLPVREFKVHNHKDTCDRCVELRKQHEHRRAT